MEFSFDSIKNTFKTRLSLLSQWATVLYYGVYERLIDAVSYITEKLSYLAEIYYRESSWKNAEKIKSLSTQAEWMSYTPYRKIGASGIVEVSSDELFASNNIYTGNSVIIPKWHEFTNEDGDVTVYSTEEKIYYTDTSGSLDIPVKEGGVKEFTYLSEGLDNEVVTLISDSVEEEYIQVDIVDVTGTVLSNVNICGENSNPEKLYFIDNVTDYYCEVKSSYTYEQVEIKFGDNVFGKKLTTGEYIKITYAETKGAEGNITSTGVVTKIKDSLSDSSGNEVTLYVQNTDEISNGNNVEDIEHIRNYGNRLFVSGYRCGGYGDWLTILENHPYINKAKVANAEDIGSVTTADLNKVFVTAISTDGSTLTTLQKSTIATFLKNENYKSVTEIIYWRDPIIVFLLFKITARVENQPFGIINSLIDTELDNQYGVLNVDFQTNIYESNYVNYIDDIQYIVHHETELFYLEKDLLINVVDYEIAVSYTSTDTTDLEKQIFLLSDTLELWLFRKISGTWNDSPIKIAEDQSGTIVGLQGDLVPPNIYDITNSAINYTTNLISFTVKTINDDPVGYGIRNPGESDDIGYILSLAYRTKDGNSEQTKHIRYPESRFISDIDPNYVYTTLSYI